MILRNATSQLQTPKIRFFSIFGTFLGSLSVEKGSKCFFEAENVKGYHFIKRKFSENKVAQSRKKRGLFHIYKENSHQSHLEQKMIKEVTLKTRKRGFLTENLKKQLKEKKLKVKGGHFD